MGNSDDEDYVYYGTPLEDEKGPIRGFYKPPQDPKKTRALPVWEQEVTDEDGRKRFHGAFTGGYSAGFYNSVGSKVRCELACFGEEAAQMLVAIWMDVH